MLKHCKRQATMESGKRALAQRESPSLAGCGVAAPRHIADMPASPRLASGSNLGFSGAAYLLLTLPGPGRLLPTEDMS
jgi:hypothetical protein